MTTLKRDRLFLQASRMSVHKEEINSAKKLRLCTDLSISEDQANDEETTQIDWERALHDVQYIICQHLPLEDLYNLMKVSTSWHNSALIELAKRPFIQQVHYKLDNSSESSVPKVLVAPNALYVKPHAALLIYDEKVEKSLAPNSSRARSSAVREKLLEDFKESLPENVFTSKVVEILHTKDIDDQGEIREADKCGLLGLFFPNLEQHFRVTYLPVVWYWDITINDNTNRLIERLGLNNYDDPNSTILIFRESSTDVSAALLTYNLQNTIKRIKDGKDSIWVAELGKGRGEAYSQRTSQQRSDVLLTVLRISSPNIESWTAKIELGGGRDQIESELYELKERVKLKRYCTALVCAPSEESVTTFSSLDIMRMIKSIFPEIPFVGLFDNHDNSAYLVRTPDVNEERPHLVLVLQRFCFMSIIIVTYD